MYTRTDQASLVCRIFIYWLQASPSPSYNLLLDWVLSGHIEAELHDTWVLFHLLLLSCTGAEHREAVHACCRVTAYFDENRRDATITAGNIAGLGTIKHIRQPLSSSHLKPVSTMGIHVHNASTLALSAVVVVAPDASSTDTQDTAGLCCPAQADCHQQCTLPLC